MILPVAPHAGAWIETDFGPEGVGALASRPMRARGLKHGPGEGFLGDGASRPMRARGLKLILARKVVGHLRRAPCGRVD